MSRSKGRYHQIGASSKRAYKKRAAINQGWEFSDEESTWVGHCKNCRIIIRLAHATLEHIVPRAVGGGNDVANLELLCQRCNALKSVEDQRETELFRAKMSIPAPIYLRSIDTDLKTVQCKMTQSPVEISSGAGCLGINSIPCPFLVAINENKVLCSWEASQLTGERFSVMKDFTTGVANEQV